MNLFLRILALALAAFALAACRQPATVESYAQNGVQFSHYSNWKVTDDEAVEGSAEVRILNLEGPDDALVLFMRVPADSPMTLESFGVSMADSRTKEVEKAVKVGSMTLFKSTKGTSEAIPGLPGKASASPGILQRFEIQVLGQKVAHEARFYELQNERHRLFVVTQVASEDAKKAQPAFDLTLGSLQLKARD